MTKKVAVRLPSSIAVGINISGSRKPLCVFGYNIIQRAGVPSELCKVMKGVDMWYKSLAFWKGASYLIAGALALLAFFGLIPAQYALEAGAVLAIVVSVLNFFGVDPELRARGLK